MRYRQHKRPEAVVVTPRPVMNPPPDFRKGSQNRESGAPAMVGLACRKERKTGYSKSARPSVADEVQRGRMSPK